MACQNEKMTDAEKLKLGMKVREKNHAYNILNKKLKGREKEIKPLNRSPTLLY